MLGRHGSRQQVKFFLKQRDQEIAVVDERHGLQQQAVQTVSAAIPVDWRRASLSRADLSQFAFGPEDVVIAVGQDGLVANVAKYLAGQPVIGINPNTERNPGVLVRHAASHTKALLEAVASGVASIEARAMVEVVSDDGQELHALNEVFIGHPAHQSAKYALEVGDALEHQSSSGVLVGTGTGATGWCSSVHRERGLQWALPERTSTDLAWFVREAWSSSWTGASLTAGRLESECTKSSDAVSSYVSSYIVVRCEGDHLVAFGDGIESDHIDLRWGQQARVQLSSKSLLLVS